MSSACDKCAKPVKGDDEFVSCMAFCDRMIHLKCSSIKLNKAFVNVIHSSPNLFWMCDECVKLIKCARFKSAISSFGSVIKSITEKQEIANAEIRNEMAKQGELIAQLSKKNRAFHSGNFGSRKSLSSTTFKTASRRRLIKQ